MVCKMITTHHKSIILIVNNFQDLKTAITHVSHEGATAIYVGESFAPQSSFKIPNDVFSM